MQRCHISLIHILSCQGSQILKINVVVLIFYRKILSFAPMDNPNVVSAVVDGGGGVMDGMTPAPVHAADPLRLQRFHFVHYIH